MPEISALPALPALPAVAGVSATAPVAGVAPAAPSLPGEQAPASFLAQLQSALSLLTQALPAVTLPSVPTLTKGQPELPAVNTDEHHDGPDSKDVMPELLAMLGFVPVPVQLPLQPQPAAATQSETQPAMSIEHAAPVSVAPAQLATAPLTSPLSAPAAEAAPVAEQAAPVITPAADAQPVAGQAVPVPAHAEPQASPIAAARPEPKHIDAAQPDFASIPQDRTQPVVDPTLLAGLTPQQVVPTQRHDAAPRGTHAAPVAEAIAPTLSVATPTSSQASSQQSGSGDPSSDTQASLADAAPVQTDAPTQSFASMATAAPQQVAGSTDVKPSHVVSQIAHQADLYRLPGGRGVRIQLHPEDMGGVGVTIKYGATGGLELHVNVEHAATGQLVQSGWTELRDALSLQGIAPDRLIMSVTGPGGASLSDSSSGGSRSEAGQASFGQAGQQHQERDNEAQSSRGWASFGDAANSSTDDARPAGVLSNSRIDYRV